MVGLRVREGDRVRERDRVGVGEARGEREGLREGVALREREAEEAERVRDGLLGLGTGVWVCEGVRVWLGGDTEAVRVLTVADSVAVEGVQERDRGEGVRVELPVMEERVGVWEAVTGDGEGLGVQLEAVAEGVAVGVPVRVGVAAAERVGVLESVAMAVQLVVAVRVLRHVRLPETEAVCELVMLGVEDREAEAHPLGLGLRVALGLLVDERVQETVKERDGD